MREISWSPSPTDQLRQRFLIKYRAWIGQGIAWLPFCPCGEKIVGAELLGTPRVSSVRYSAYTFEIKSWENRCCAWELGESGERSSCRWCITLLIEYECGKTGLGVGASRRGGVVTFSGGSETHHEPRGVRTRYS